MVPLLTLSPGAVPECPNGLSALDTTYYKNIVGVSEKIILYNFFFLVKINT